MTLNELWQGLAFQGVMLPIIGGYTFWNIRIKGLKPKRMNDEIDRVKSDREEMKRVSTQTVPALISHASTLSAMTFAALVIVIAWLLLEGNNLEGINSVIMYIVLGLVGIATMSYLFCLEQFTKLLPPFRPSEKMANIYKASINTWLFALILLIIAILLLVLLVNVYLFMAMSFITTLLLIRFMKLSNEW